MITSALRGFAAHVGVVTLTAAALAQPCVEWVDRTDRPVRTAGGGMVYDSGRGVAVLHCEGYGVIRGTWEWDGSEWTLGIADSLPDDGAMAYDSARGVTVFFGGARWSDGAPQGDTWEWDGISWTQVASSGPSARCDHAMAYDSARGVTVLFGGRDGDWVYNTETWEWDGSAWTLQATTGPSPRVDHGMAYDSARGVTVLFGGRAGPDGYDDTWEWDGVSWTQVASSGPSPRTGHGMAYDSARGVTVLFGGYGGLGDTWEWDGSTWTLRAAAGPGPRSFFGMAYDSDSNQTLLYGGGYYGVYDNRMWGWDGTSWTLCDTPWPPSCSGNKYPGTYDSARGVTVYFACGETWEWDGTLWSPRAASGPSTRDDSAMVYDSARGVCVLFGGSSGGGETWEWDGYTWTQRFPGTAPSPRSGHAMAYDSARGVTVLFGGTYGAVQTWEWDGTSWTHITSSGPPGREHHAMAYDSARGVTVLFGGRTSGNTLYGDTWEWDGTSWTQRDVSGPEPRAYHAMAYDSARGVCVLTFGYWDFYFDTWEWDSTAWTERVIPPPGRPSALAYDSARGVTVFLGRGTNTTKEFGPVYPGDLNGDAVVDLADLADLLGDYGCAGADCLGDIDRDGDTDLTDLAALMGDYGGGCDCNGNGIADDLDLGQETSTDCNGNLTPDECDISEGVSEDCNANGIPDECIELENDCNGNGVPDECDIDEGTSDDYDLNGVPDECDPDCNENGVPDPCDTDCATGNCAHHPLGCGGSEDCDTNSVPDECPLVGGDPADSVAQDDCFLAEPVCPGIFYSGTTSGSTNDGSASCGGVTSPDVWYAYVPAEHGTLAISLCGSTYDTVLSVHGGCPGDADNEIVCNDDSCGQQSQVTFDVLAGLVYLIRIAGWNDATGDFTMVLTGPACPLDCNTNGVPDACDVADGTSPDCNANGLPDECDIVWTPLSQWASTVIDFSSEWSSGNWSAAQALGAPDTWSYGDHETAWCPSSRDGTIEYIVVGYFTPVYATGATIRETLGNGYVTQVDVREVGGELHTVWAGTDPSEPGEVVDFLVEWPATAFLVDGLKVTITTDATAVWEEMDALQLHGRTNSSLDCNANGTPDECDVADGSSDDCNANEIPDECESDCNANGVADECDIANGTSRDFNDNGVLDECECLGDIVEDDEINLTDLAQLLGNYGMTGGAVYTDGDLDADGDVDLTDLAEMVGLYGTVCIYCPGDLTGDDFVGLADLAQLVGNYGMTSGAVYTDGDLDFDGDVDLTDLAELLGLYGTTCE